MFGFSPVMMAPAGPPPFSFSGSWESDNEGWTFVQNINRGFGGFARTGVACLQGFGGFEAVSIADYVIAGAVCAGKTITAKVWHRCGSQPYGPGLPPTRSLQYRIGTGSFITLQTVTNDITSYAQLTGTFLNAGSQDVTIRIRGVNGPVDEGHNPIFDDWSIEGI